jgi:RNA polymerase sigma-70 factor, ECF subfamily
MPDKIAPRESAADPITGLLTRLREGNKEAEAELVPLVYKELHRLAQRYMRGERQGHTLQTSALVNEAYMRLAGERAIAWKNRAHFFGVSAQIMRRILVDHARTRNAQKRGGPAQKISLENAFAYTPEQSWQIIALHEALTKLAEWDPRQCRIVELRFFGGLDVDETSEVLGISPTTVKREFQHAKAWLYAELNKTLKTENQESSQ